MNIWIARYKMLKRPAQRLEFRMSERTQLTQDCSHPSGETGRCILCHAPLCRMCTVNLDPEHSLCLPCFQGVEQARTMGPGEEAAPRNYPILTLIFCGLLAGLYCVSALPDLQQGNPIVLYLSSLNLPAVVEGHEYWRLITANLLHVNLSHMGMNVFALLIFGSLLEPQIGWRYLLGWMLAAMLACDITSILFDVPNSIGASGIAYGLQTGYIGLTAKILIAHQTQHIAKTLQSLLGYLILMVIINFMSVSEEPINIFGHFGGAITGLITAIVYPVTRPPETRDTWTLAGLVICLIIALLVLVF